MLQCEWPTTLTGVLVNVIKQSFCPPTMLKHSASGQTSSRASHSAAHMEQVTFQLYCNVYSIYFVIGWSTVHCNCTPHWEKKRTTKKGYMLPCSPTMAWQCPSAQSEVYGLPRLEWKSPDLNPLNTFGLS